MDLERIGMEGFGSQEDQNALYEILFREWIKLLLH